MQEKPHHRHHHQHNHHHHNFRSTQHLTGGCDSQTLEKYNISLLANAAGLNQHCTKLATDIFQRRFASDFVEISTIDSASFHILKHFGHLISSLAINLIRFGKLCTANEIAKYRNLLQYASHYGRNSVKTLRISYNENCWNTHYDVDIFYGIKSSFDRVENGSINLRGATIKTNSIQLKKFIPNVRHLELNFESLSDPIFISGEYPNLDKLSISGRLLDKSYDEVFKNLLLENPQIRSVSLVQPSYQIFQHLEKYSKNLKEIEILRSIRGERPQEIIHLSSVERLVLRFDRHGCHPLEGISFGQELNELVFECQPQNVKYFNTLSTLRQIKKLSTGNTKLNDENLLKLAGEFPKLIEAEFWFHENVTVDSIAKFIRSNQKMNKLSFWYFSKSESNGLLNQIETSIDTDFDVHKSNENDSKAAFFVIKRKMPPIHSGIEQFGCNVFILASAILIGWVLSTHELTIFV